MADGRPQLVVLGTAQDGGYPAPGCQAECCNKAWRNPAMARLVACLGLVDPISRERWMIDCTPDFKLQLHRLNEVLPKSGAPALDGILLTHAHTGHYAGLLNLGREMMATDAVPVYAAKGMIGFLLANEPWRSLIDQGNISVKQLHPGRIVELSPRLSIHPFTVPHRDELSETLGFRVLGPERSVVYIPDIDAWEGLKPPIETMIAENDQLYLDGSFFSKDELPHRNPAEIPHPCIKDSITRFAGLPDADRLKVVFTHFNHTNPVIDLDSTVYRELHAAGMMVASDGDILEL